MDNTCELPGALEQVMQICQDARRAQADFAAGLATVKTQVLHSLADALIERADEICAANHLDLQRGRENGMSEGLLDRLALSKQRLTQIAQSVRQVAALPDPCGQVVDGRTLENGLEVRRVRVPMGVVAMIYEARPNVTVDAAALCIRSGNAAILRGGSAAENSNTALVKIIRQALSENGVNPNLVASVDYLGRAGANALMRARGGVDLLIPRGGASLIQACVENATVPVIETGVGNCHIYVDASARREDVIPIVLNAKTQRVGVCNAAETLLVDRACAAEVIPEVVAALVDAGVTVHADSPARSYLQPDTPGVVVATQQDFATEYLSLDIALGVVEGVTGAIEHVGKYSSGHTEAVLAQDASVISQFVNRVDAAAVAVNASTRFTDGGQLGLGAEIGISTQKMHARGPFALQELTTVKWIITGQGHVRP